ncbi:transcriptional regulator [Enterovirga rhinocerotis]|uniref:Uncharacterized protein n=1 Tax=Enterovirga rhinocerotis TaxID=1339210 RepID=A0A4R7BKP8_9HYPH|nr:transcriptional regulator [Enterovirga rhinocerotis]TDR85152.1 hypothetical protein EV668_4696 [Enterovirga rhinocerotis]
MTGDKDAKIARAEARFQKVEAQATRAAEAKAAHDAEILARDANTERLKRLRLARDEAARLASESEKPKPKVRKSR